MCPQFHVWHVMGSRYMFVCWLVVDVIVELGVWRDLYEKLSIGCRILRDFFYKLYGVGQE